MYWILVWNGATSSSGLWRVMSDMRDAWFGGLGRIALHPVALLEGKSSRSSNLQIQRAAAPKATKVRAKPIHAKSGKFEPIITRTPRTPEPVRNEPIATTTTTTAATAATTTTTTTSSSTTTVSPSSSSSSLYDSSSTPPTSRLHGSGIQLQLQQQQLLQQSSHHMTDDESGTESTSETRTIGYSRSDTASSLTGSFSSGNLSAIATGKPAPKRVSSEKRRMCACTLRGGVVVGGVVVVDCY
jgi:hypothetical protein